MPSTDDFNNALFRMIYAAERAGMDSLEVEAGDLHQRVGGYPGPDHNMPLCCEVMRVHFDPAYGDAMISMPPDEQGASLKIRYHLPRG